MQISQPPQQPLMAPQQPAMLPMGMAPAPQMMAAAPAPFASPAAPPPSIPRQLLLAADKGKGLQVAGGFSRRDGQLLLDLLFTNMTPEPMTGFAIQFNRNTFGLAPAAPLNLSSLAPQQTVHYPLPLVTNGPISQGPASVAVQMAIKNNVDIHYFAPDAPLHVLFTEGGRLEKQQYLQMWRAIPEANEHTRDVALPGLLDVETLQRKLELNNLFFIARRRVNEQDVVYLSARLTNDVVILVEITLVPGQPVMKVRMRVQMLCI
jgi:hypothetical protein